MKSFFKILHRFAEWGCVLSLASMVAVVALQVIVRLIPGMGAPSWTEELSRILFIYSVAFGAGLGIRGNAFVKLDLIEEYCSKRTYRILQLVIHSCVGVFSLLLVWYAWRFAGGAGRETSPVLGINMTLVFTSMVLMMVFIAVFTAEKWIETWKGLRQR